MTAKEKRERERATRRKSVLASNVEVVEMRLTSLLHKLLQPVCVLDVGTRLGVVLATVLEDQVRVVEEIVQRRVEVRVEFELHR